MRTRHRRGTHEAATKADLGDEANEGPVASPRGGPDARCAPSGAAAGDASSASVPGTAFVASFVRVPTRGSRGQVMP